jgi:hypothetical protein
MFRVPQFFGNMSSAITPPGATTRASALHPYTSSSIVSNSSLSLMGLDT